MYPVTSFVREVERIAATKPRYKTGGTGKNGVCDCMGLDMGAMYELGHPKYDLHSTNYFARFQTLELKKIKDEKDLFIGQVLYRARTDTGKLDDRYKPGGAHYTGDPLDYYHVLTVTSVNPLRIVECTEFDGVDGINITTRLRGTYYGGKLRGVDYTAKEAEDMSVLYQARVITKEDPLTLRNAPISGKKIGELPKGAVVDVYGSGDWPRVRYGELLGYASAQYLEEIKEDAQEPENPEAELPENVLRFPGDVRIIDDAGNVFRPVGNWRTVFGDVD